MKKYTFSVWYIYNFVEIEHILFKGFEKQSIRSRKLPRCNQRIPNIFIYIHHGRICNLCYARLRSLATSFEVEIVRLLHLAIFELYIKHPTCLLFVNLEFPTMGSMQGHFFPHISSVEITYIKQQLSTILSLSCIFK